MMALLVAQTRVEAGVHTTLEVLYGGVLGAMVTAAIFQVFPDARHGDGASASGVVPADRSGVVRCESAHARGDR